MLEAGAAQISRIEASKASWTCAGHLMRRAASRRSAQHGAAATNRARELPLERQEQEPIPKAKRNRRRRRLRAGSEPRERASTNPGEPGDARTAETLAVPSTPTRPPREGGKERQAGLGREGARRLRARSQRGPASGRSRARADRGGGGSGGEALGIRGRPAWLGTAYSQQW